MSLIPDDHAPRKTPLIDLATEVIEDFLDFPGPAPPCEPTDILPGPQKVEILAERYARRQCLFSPADPGFIDQDRCGLLLTVAPNGSPSPDELVEQHGEGCTCKKVPKYKRKGRGR